MKKRLFLVILFIVPVAYAQEVPSDSSAAVLDSIYSVIKSRSLHREQVDWNSIDAQFESNVDSATSFRFALNAFREVFRELGDVHSAIYYKGSGIGYWGESSYATSQNVGELISKSRQQAGNPIGRLLKEGIGYILVPSYGLQGQDAIDQASQALREVVCSLSDSVSSGWMIDLRLNEGGNVYPMLTGLGDLLGDRVVARSVDAMETPNMEWSIRDGVLHLDEYKTTTVDQRCTKAHDQGKVAVLIGPATLSSGQITAVAFSGWDQARLFGEPTGDGYATSNQWYQITPGLGLNLSEAYFADRSGFVHKGIVLPDEVVEGVWDFDALEEDDVVLKALHWISQNE